MILFILDTIKSISKTNEKLNYLKNNYTTTVRKVLEAALSSEVVYGIKNIPEPSLANATMTIEEAIDIINNEFANNKVTGNARIKRTHKILEALTENDQKVLTKILKKKLDCGINIKNANKVLKELNEPLIPVFDVMLCSKYDKKALQNIPIESMVLQTKMDGMRVIVSIDDNGNVKYRTRNGKLFQLSDRYDEFFSEHKGKVFDGEAVIVKDGKILDRKVGNGILNSIRQGKADKELINMVHFYFWDIIDYNEFFDIHDNIKKPSYSKRFNELTNLYNQYQNVGIFSLPKSHYPIKFEDIEEFYKINRENGEEGIIVKDLRKLYEKKRVKHHIKMKAEETSDLQVIGFIEGEGKYNNHLGAIVCKTADDKLYINVGSGFNDEDRKKIWENSHDYLYKIVEVKYNEVIKNNKGEYSLFLPVFVGFRDDKNTANTLKELK